jgi:hypothetical protein
MPLSPKLFSQLVGTVVDSVRSNAVAPRMINTDYAADLAKQGSSITVNFPGPVPIRDVIPANIPPVTANPTNNGVTLTLDNWKEAPFTISESDLSGLGDPKSYISKQLVQAGVTIADAVDTSILTLYQNTPFTAGTAGTTPFASSLAALQSAETTLLTNKMPPGQRSLLLDTFAWGNSLGLSVFQNNQAFGTEVIREGRVTRALGYDWAYDQNVVQHTRGALGGTPLINGVQAIGTVNVVTDGWSNSITNILRVGDIVTFAGDPNPYVVTANCNSNGSGVVTIPIYNGYADLANSGLLVATVDNAAITVTASHKASLAMHPNFAMIASRTPDIMEIEGGQKFSYRVPWTDPISGLTFLIKVSEQHWQAEFSVSCLWGVKPVWTQHAVRLLG